MPELDEGAVQARGEEMSEEVKEIVENGMYLAAQMKIARVR